MKRSLFAFIFALLMLCLSGTAALAQSTSAVTGIVTDPTGAVLNGVNVKLTNPKTGLDLSTQTNDDGVYSFVKVAPGPGHVLTFTAPGFETLVLQDVPLGVGVTETHNVKMTIGQVSNTVTVTSDQGPTLNTTNATISNVIEERRMKELPIQIRSSPASLLGLQPGVVGNVVGTGGNRIGSVTGSRADQGNITIDGIDANDQTTGQAFATVGNAPIDAIQEFRAVTTNPGADEGRSSGGQIQLVTKSGTNDFHGSLREFNRTAKTAANSFFNNRSGIARPQLTRNQFGGSIGGPIIKDALFFFFDTEWRKDRQGVSYSRIVPLPHLRNGGVAFLNNVAGCPTNARLTTRPDCITVLTPAQVAALDPKGIGASPQLLTFIQSRYPLPNDLSLGNGINTGGFRFNSPSKRNEETYTSRIDWDATDKQQFFGRFNIARRAQTDTINTVAQQFPDDPESGTIVIRDYAWVVGHTWVATPTVVNQVTVGVTRQGAIFDSPFAPAFPNSFTFGGGLTAPYAGISTQDRFVLVPTIRDDLTWTKGAHSLQLGGQLKPIKQVTGLVNDFNFVTIGLGGLNAALNNDTRPGGANIGTAACLNNPACIGAGATRQGSFDSPYAFILGRIASLSTNFNYDPSAVASPPGTGKVRDWRYNELELYAADTWRARNDLTISGGVRWHLYPAPYEAKGFQACNDTDLRPLFDTRVRNAALGISGAAAEPILRYDLCGKANSARAMYETDLNNFAPRLSFAYNPSFKDGILGKVFGDRKTVIRGGGSVTYDRVGGAISFIQDQVSYLFDNSATRAFGNSNPRTALLNDPRFTGITTLPVANTPPVITRPFTPFNIPTPDCPIAPTGNCSGETNYAVDQTFRIPYSISYSFGFQREMPGNFILEASYVGRQGRKLFTQADAAQVLDFRDPASGQFMLAAFNNLQLQIENGSPITVQPWFENQINPASIANYGVPCSGLGLGANCSQLVANFLGSLVEIGDTADSLQALYGNFLLNPNVGLSGQFSTNAYITNAGASSYNGLLISVRKRFAKGFQFDVNYTLSHSIDNQSSIVNTVFGGLVCDVRNLRVCRGNSDFDIRHIVNANGIWELPFGRGKLIGGNANGLVDTIIGGWELSGIFNYRSGLAFGSTTDSFPVGFVFNSPGVITGNTSAFEGSPHDVGSTIQYFKDPVAAQAALRNPRHGEIGNRNALRGPKLWIADMALLKNFKLPWKENLRLQIRAEAFNVFNHNNFGLPNANINGTTFGQITTTSTAAREFQFGIRLDF